jgi:hypothetical protein
MCRREESARSAIFAGDVAVVGGVTAGRRLVCIR